MAPHRQLPSQFELQPPSHESCEAHWWGCLCLTENKRRKSPDSCRHVTQMTSCCLFLIDLYDSACPSERNVDGDCGPPTDHQHPLVLFPHLSGALGLRSRFGPWPQTSRHFQSRSRIALQPLPPGKCHPMCTHLHCRRQCLLCLQHQLVSTQRCGWTYKTFPWHCLWNLWSFIAWLPWLLNHKPWKSQVQQESDHPASWHLTWSLKRSTKYSMTSYKRCVNA